MGKRAVAEVVADAVEEVAEVDPDAAALAERKAAKKAKKAVAAAAAAATEEVQEEKAEDAEAAALAERKAAKKAKKAAAAAAAAATEEVEMEDAEAAALTEKKAAKKAKKAGAAAAVAEPAAEEKAEEEVEKKAAPEKKKEEEPKKKVDGAEEEEWKDIPLKCVDCEVDFEFTVGEQTFFFEKGIDGQPKRCKDCRWAKKNGKEGGDAKGKGKGKGKEGGKGGHDNENTVFVRGLPFATTEESLTKDFAECGEIVSLRMPLNDEGSCKGIAFIKYTAKEGCDKAIAFNETDYGGRTIYCAMAGDSPGGKGKDGKGKGKDGKGKDGKGKDGKGKGKGKKGKAPSEAFAKSSGAIVESTGEKKTFADSDDE